MSKDIFSRVSPSEVCGTKGYDNASVFFLESRNLHKVASQMKGVCCAVLVKNQKQATRRKPIMAPRWRLAYCWKFLPESDCLQVFMWKGPTVPDAAHSHVPAFFYGDKGSFLATKSDFETHFEYRSLQASTVPHIFLNQVNGFRPGGFACRFSNINEQDGCFQCNPAGPDSLILPPTAPDFLPSNNHPENYLEVPKKQFTVDAKHGRPPSYDWTAYKVAPVYPHITPPSSKKRKYHRKKRPAWTPPPTIPMFHGKDVTYRVVYVEDSLQRLKVDHPKSYPKVAMPFLQTIDE